jgi:hypothetical protein
VVTEGEDVEWSVLLKHRGAWRALFAQLHRDTEGNAEWFVVACAVGDVLHDGGYPDGGRTHHQSRRTEPFLKRWQGAMNHWASRNCDVLKKSLSCHSREADRAPGWRPISDRVLVTPASPARPALSLPVLRKLEPSANLYRGSLSTS